MKNYFVSIIVPVLNEEKCMAKCLNSIICLDYPRSKYEVILVDNGSRDKTIEIAKKYNVKILIKPGVTIGTLRNFGAKYAKGEILAFVDADCVVDRDWLKLAVFDLKKNKNLVAVGNRSLTPADAFWLERLWNKITFVFDQKVVYLPGRNFIIRKDIFKEIEGFDGNLITGEDPELCYRLYEKGYFLRYNPYLRVTHLGYPKNIFQFVYKKIWYILSYFYLFRKHGLRTKMGVKFLILLLVILFISLSIILILNY